jgi:hypothetical protein
VFWLWGVAGSWVLAGLFLAGVVTVGVSWALYWIAAVITIAYTVWILVSVWRCAEGASDQWRLIAPMLTVAWALNVFFVGLFLGFELLALRLA